MALRLVGRQMAAGAGRALLGAPPTQIRFSRGYCQKVSSNSSNSSNSEHSPGRTVAFFVAGAVSSLTFFRLWLGTRLDEFKAKERARSF